MPRTTGLTGLEAGRIAPLAVVPLALKDIPFHFLLVAVERPRRGKDIIKSDLTPYPTAEVATGD